MTQNEYDQLPARRKCEINGKPYYMVKDATGRHIRPLEESQSQTRPQGNALSREQWESLPARFRMSIGDNKGIRVGKHKGTEFIILFELY